jgi:hypothetical protein
MFWGKDLRLRVQGLGFGVCSVGFGVWGFRIRG